MPKIEAPTVVEHHRRRRRALLDAGMALLAEAGVDAVTPAAVGAAAGLARSSVYQYFDSSAALLAALVEDAFPRSIDRLHAAVDRAGTPRERVEAYLRTSLRLAADPSHQALHTLAGTEVPPPCRARLTELHERLYQPLVVALADLGDPDPALTAHLLLGLLRAAVRLGQPGAPVAGRVERRLLALVREGLPG